MKSDQMVKVMNKLSIYCLLITITNYYRLVKFINVLNLKSIIIEMELTKMI